MAASVWLGGNMSRGRIDSVNGVLLQNGNPTTTRRRYAIRRLCLKKVDLLSFAKRPKTRYKNDLTLKIYHFKSGICLDRITY